MKVCDIINPYKAMVEREMLEEARLSTAFSIGFELEGICDSNEEGLESPGRMPHYHSDDSARGGAAELKNKLDKMLDMGEGTINSLTDTVGNFISDIAFTINGIPGEFRIDTDNNIIYSAEGSDSEVNNRKVGDLYHRTITFNNDFYKLPNTKNISKEVTINKSKIESDSSVHPDRNTDSTHHAWSFEWASPIIKFNPKNIDKIYKFLTSLKDIGVYTNNSCGFHTHISYENITRDDVKWILFCIANDEKLLDEVSYLRVPGEEPIKFFGDYAKDSWFRKLKAHGNLEDWSFYEDTGDKYLQMRMHPDAGTIEWRGPRNFINKGENTQLIKDYLIKLWQLVLKIAKIVDEKEYNGYKKEDVLQKLTVSGRFNSAAEKLASMSAEKLVSLVKTKPLILVTLPPSKLKNLVKQKSDAVFYGSGTDFTSEFKIAWDKMPKANKKIIAETALEHGYVERLFSMIVKDGKIDDVSTEAIIMGNADKRNFNETLIKYEDTFTITKPEILEYIWKSKCPNNIKLKVLSHHPQLLSLKIFTEIANSKDRHILANFSEIPVRVQRLLIRKSPYNIQYINNPDQSIINELKKKYGDDINDYILGVL